MKYTLKLESLSKLVLAQCTPSMYGYPTLWFLRLFYKIIQISDVSLMVTNTSKVNMIQITR
jgi:hypothetical protein